MRCGVQSRAGCSGRRVTAFNRELRTDFIVATLPNRGGYHLDLEFSDASPRVLVGGTAEESSGNCVRRAILRYTGQSWVLDWKSPVVEPGAVELCRSHSLNDIRSGEIFNCTNAVPTTASWNLLCGEFPGDFTLDDLLAEQRWALDRHSIGDCARFWTLRWSDGCVLMRSVSVGGIEVGTNPTWIDTDSVELGRPTLTRQSLTHPGRLHSRDGPLEIVATSREEAERVNRPTDLLDMVTVAKVDQELLDVTGTRTIILEVPASPTLRIPSGPSQVVEFDRASGRVRLTLGPSSATSAVVAEERDEALKRSPRYADGGIEGIVDLVVRNVASPRDRVTAFLALIREQITYELVPGCLPLRSVIESRRGDCSELANLFVALARSAGVPAREVGGLLYAGGVCRGFVHHQWAEVALDGRWVSVDPTTGAIPAGAARIGLAWGEASSECSFGAPGTIFHVLSDESDASRPTREHTNPK